MMCKIARLRGDRSNPLWVRPMSLSGTVRHAPRSPDTLELTFASLTSFSFSIPHPRICIQLYCIACSHCIDRLPLRARPPCSSPRRRRRPHHQRRSGGRRPPRRRHSRLITLCSLPFAIDIASPSHSYVSMLLPSRVTMLMTWNHRTGKRVRL